MKAVGRCPGLY